MLGFFGGGSEPSSHCLLYRWLATLLQVTLPLCSALAATCFALMGHTVDLGVLQR